MKRNKGITLIALVVTIIVLIILAGVSVNLVLGQNGIITKAKEAKKEHEKEAIKEKVSLMMGEYATEREENNKKLRPYLEEKEKVGEIESIEESEENEEGTQAIIVDDYRVVIDEETLEILEIGKAGPRPKITNIKITYTDAIDGTQKEATEKSVIEGTPLKITFDVSFEEGTLVEVNKGTLENGKIEYTTDGTEVEVIFIVIGKIGEEEYQKSIKVTLEKFYKEAFISDIVKVGDFVNYSVGNWTQEDIDKIGSYYEGENLPSKSNYFGGFKVGQSKDATIKPDTSLNLENVYSGGWRVLSKNEDGTIKIIHAGTPEAYYVPRSTHNDSALKPAINILGSYRDWSMYEDSSIDDINTNYAVINSAHCITKQEILSVSQASTLRTIGVKYYYNYKTAVGSPYYTLQGINHRGDRFKLCI